MEDLISLRCNIDINLCVVLHSWQSLHSCCTQDKVRIALRAKHFNASIFSGFVLEPASCIAEEIMQAHQRWRH